MLFRSQDQDHPAGPTAIEIPSVVAEDPAARPEESAIHVAGSGEVAGPGEVGQGALARPGGAIAVVHLNGQFATQGYWRRVIF